MTAPFNELLVFAAEVSDQPAGRPAPTGTNPLLQLAPFVLILFAFFWFMSRSQKKRDRKRKDMLDSIRPKDDVVTIGGIQGRVLQVKEDEVVLRIDPDKDVKITIAKTGVSRKVGDEEPK